MNTDKNISATAPGPGERARLGRTGTRPAGQFEKNSGRRPVAFHQVGRGGAPDSARGGRAPRDPAAQPRLSTLDPRRSTGFTLIELLVVVAIIALLAGLVVATVGSVQKNSVRNKAQAEVEALSRAIENYKLEIGSYPPESPATALYNELTGNGTINRTKVYFEPPRSMVTNSRFIDPWGNFYTYDTTDPVNVGLFDILTTAGQTTNTNLYIRN